MLSQLDTATQALLDQISDGFVALGRDWRIQFINRQAEPFFGRPRQGLIGKNLWEEYPEAVGSDYYRAYHEALSTGRMVSLETYHAATEQWFHIRAHPFGEGLGVFYQDVTERVRSEAARDQSERRYRWLVENTTESVWRFDLEQPMPVTLPAEEQVDYFYRHAYMAECNEGTARIYGYASAAEMTGMRLGELLLRDDPANEAYLTAFVHSGYRLVDAESVETDSAGRKRYFLNNLVGTVEDGCLVRAWGTSRDITERREAEEQLRISRERLDLVLRSIDLGLWYWDLPFEALNWNDTCKRHFGLPPDAPVTLKVFYERIHPDDRHRTRRAIEQCIQDRTLYDIDYRTLAPDGRERWIRAIGSAFYDETGVPRRFDGITVDITEQKRALEQLAEADRRKNEFLAMLAHELRNPLSPIVNAVQILRVRGAEDPALQRSRDVIERQVRQMARLIDDLLDVSRITMGKVELRLESVGLADIIAGALEAVRPLLEGRSQQLTVHLPERPVRVRADAARLQQVLINLLNNAAKFTPPEGRVEVELTEEGEEAVVRVRDTGFGMERDLVPRVFDLFMQGDQGLARMHGGLGIGLTMVRTLVELHGGSVSAFSEGPGRGSEFTVRLPVETGGAADPPAAGAETGTPDDRRRRVLVVDDNVDAAETLAELLDGWGHEVRTAHDGEQALLQVREFQPEVLLLDIGMPRLDGYQVAARLREEGWNGRLIALTGYGDQEHRARSAAAGFDHHVTKPVPLEELRALIAARA